MDTHLIFLDVDGTITDRRSRIPESAVNAIRKARENGHLCVVNTGRPYSHLTPELKEIGFDGYICSCGQTIVRDGVFLKHIRCSHELSEYVIRTAEACGIDLFMEGERGLWPFFRHEMKPGVQREFERFRKRGFAVDEDIHAPDFSFDKFCTWEYPDSEAERFRKEVSSWFTPTDRGGTLFEMVRNGCSKAEGIRQFLAITGIHADHTLAAGDSTNDISMLTAVAHPIAMGNGDQELMKYAEYVTSSSGQKGLERAFRHYGLI